jgi:hypothetical protein
VSDQSGRSEVYVQSFPDVGGGKWQISAEGGDQPSCRADGQELYFMASDLKLMSVGLKTEPVFQPGAPRALFATRTLFSGPISYRNQYTPRPDGQRFLVNSMSKVTGASEIGIAINWQAGLKSPDARRR